MSGCRRGFALLKFILIFLKVFLQANLSVAYTVLFIRKERIQPILVEYPVDDLGRWETLFMAQLITLTPGTLVAKIDEDKKFLLVHILTSTDPERDLQQIREEIEKPLLEVTRR